MVATFRGLVKATFWICACIAGISCAGPAAHAQLRPSADKSVALSASPSLGQALEAAWQRALQASEASGRVARARAEQTASTAWWAAPPSLELSHGTGRLHGNGDERETEVGVSVPLWLPGQRQARGQAAQAELEAAEVGEAAARLEVAGQVREAAWAIAALKAEVASLASRQRSLKALASDVDRRVSAGDLARTDSLAARAEVLSVEGMLAEAGARLQAAEAHWVALTGLGQIANPGEPAAQLSSTAHLDAHPDLNSAMRKVELARKRLELVSRSKRSPPEMMAWYRNEKTGSPAPSSNVVGIGVRLPLSADDRNLPLMAAASSEYDVAQAAERSLRERLVAELAAARAGLAAAQQQFELERSRSVMLSERTRLVAAAFRAGETSLPETLRTYAASTQAEASLARQEAALGLARARLQQALGHMP